MTRPTKTKRRRDRPVATATRPAPTAAPEPLHIPIEEDLDDEFDDNFEDDGSLLVEDIADDDAPQVDESVEFVKATPLQEAAGRLFRERQERLAVMQQNANLEQEIAKLRGEVAETRIQKLKDQAAAIANADAAMFAEAGLNEGDQLKFHEGSFVVIPKGK